MFGFIILNKYNKQLFVDIKFDVYHQYWCFVGNILKMSPNPNLFLPIMIILLPRMFENTRNRFWISCRLLTYLINPFLSSLTPCLKVLTWFWHRYIGVYQLKSLRKFWKPSSPRKSKEPLDEPRWTSRRTRRTTARSGTSMFQPAARMLYHFALSEHSCASCRFPWVFWSLALSNTDTPTGVKISALSKHIRTCSTCLYTGLPRNECLAFIQSVVAPALIWCWILNCPT